MRGAPLVVEFSSLLTYYNKAGILFIWDWGRDHGDVAWL